jgi:hypothetical protein
MTYTITCPSCRRQLRVPDDLLGCMVKCPACSDHFPAEEPAPPPRPSAGRGRAEYDDPRPPRRPRDEEDDDRLLRRRRVRIDEDGDDDYSRARRREEKPGKVTAIGVMMLVGGILALLHGVGWAVSVVGLCWPGTYYSFVMGVMAIVKGSQLLGERAYRESPPQAVAIMQIINIVVLDVINLTMGIINLVFLSDPEVKRYFRR